MTTKVICFRGLGDSGKSKTIKKILCSFFKINIYPEKKDFRMSFEYHGKKILLCSYGDNLRDMKPIFETINPHEFDVFICACHPNNDVYRKLADEFDVENIKFIECPRVESEEEYKRRRELFEVYCSIKSCVV